MLLRYDSYGRLGGIWPRIPLLCAKEIDKFLPPPSPLQCTVQLTVLLRHAGMMRDKATAFSFFSFSLLFHGEKSPPFASSSFLFFFFFFSSLVLVLCGTDCVLTWRGRDTTRRRKKKCGEGGWVGVEVSISTLSYFDVT